MELSEIQTEYEEVKQKLESMKAQRRAIADEIFVQHALISTIRIMPPEVLGLIFLWYTEDFTQSPWTLMQVSRAWRSAAMHTRGLWARIMITSPAWKDRGLRRKDGREICTGTDQLKRALNRAGSFPLDVLIYQAGPSKAWSWKSRQLASTAVLEMLTLMKTIRKIPQIHRLELTDVEGIKVDDLPFLNLEAVKIKSRLCEDIITQINKTSQKMASLELDSVWMSHLREIRTSALVKILSIRELVVDIGTEWSYDSFQGNLREFLNSYPALKTLEVRNVDKGATVHSPGEPLTFSNLQTLVLINSKVFWAVNASNLTNLALIKDSALVKVHRTSPNDFPSLNTLTISSSNLSALNAIRAPFLHTLNLCCTAGVMSSAQTYAGFIQILKDGQIDPTVFHLHNTAIMPLVLVEIIDRMSRLNELRLRSVAVKPKFFEALAGFGLDSSPDAIVVPCPSLTRLSIDCSEVKQRLDTKVIKPAAQKAIKSRVDSGHAMDEACLRITKERGWFNLLS